MNETITSANTWLLGVLGLRSALVPYGTFSGGALVYQGFRSQLTSGCQGTIRTCAGTARLSVSSAGWLQVGVHLRVMGYFPPYLK